MNTVADHLPSADVLRIRPERPLRGADLPLLVSLDVLLQERNVTRAATRLHLSQPALSAQLARLRQLFDDPLLLPTANRRGYLPSPFAADLHRRLKPALATLAGAIQTGADAFRPATDVRRFTIAAGNTAAAMIVPALLGKVQAYGNPALQFAIAEPEGASLADSLAAGATDLLLSCQPMLPPGLRSSQLFATPWVLAQRRGHPQGSGPVSLDAYCQAIRHVNVGQPASLHGRIDEQLYRKGRVRQVALAVRDFSFVPALLEASDLCCTMPARLLEALDTRLELRQLDFVLAPYGLCMAWHPDKEDDPGLGWLRGELAAIGAALGAG